MRRVLLVVAFVLACLAPAVPAQARSAVAELLNSDGNLLQGGCGDYLLNYDLHVPPGTFRYAVDIYVDAPDKGHGYAGVYTGDDPTGTTEVFLCPGGKFAGIYSVTFEGYYEDAAGGQEPVTGQGAFRLRKAKTTSFFRASTHEPRFNQAVRITAEVRVERRKQDEGLREEPVNIQFKSGGRWYNLRDLTTGRGGKVSRTYLWDTHTTYQLRTKTPGSRSFRGSTSKPVTMNPR